jgi:hypothetical protein
MELLPLISSYEPILDPAEGGSHAMLGVEYEPELGETSFQELLHS